MTADFAAECHNPHSVRAPKAYDTSRVVKKKFAGAVQQKSSAAGTEKAIAQMERVKPGSAKRGTLRVPRDQVIKTRNQARGRIRVGAMEFTGEQASSKLDQGLRDVAEKGSTAGSTLQAAGKGAAIGAAVNVAIGSATDAVALKRGEIDTRDFTENRAVDAAEGATNAVVGMAVASTGGALATAALGTSAGATAAASAGAAGTAAVGAISGLGTVGAAVGGALGSVTVAAAAPAVLSVAAGVGSGIVVTKGYKRVRRELSARQERRRQLTAASGARWLAGPDLDENGEPIIEAVLVEEELPLAHGRRGRTDSWRLRRTRSARF